MDDQLQDAGDVFRIPDLWGPSGCLNLGLEHSSALFSQLKLDGSCARLDCIEDSTNTCLDLDIKLPEIVDPTPYHDPFFTIPDLSLGLPEDIPTPNETPNSQEDPVELQLQDNAESEQEDIWLLPEEKPLKLANYQSWATFGSAVFREPNTPYITEAGTSIFDAAIVAGEDYLRVTNAEHVVVDTSVYLSSLLALGLGRSSAFYFWDDDKHIFRPTVAKFRISGYTADLLDGLVATFIDCGNITKFLQEYVDTSYDRIKSPGQIALAESVSTLLTVLQTRLSASAITHNTLLQLQTLFKPAHSVLTCFQRIVRNISSARNDESMLSTIFQEVQVLEHRTDSLRDVLLEILSRVSKPWLEFSSEWLGLQRELGMPMTKNGKGRGFVKVENREWVNEQGIEFNEPDFLLDYDKVPSFIAPDDARSMFEVGRSLRFLRSHHPDHPLSKAEVVASANPPMMDWHFSWQDIVHIERKAFQYEQDLVAALQTYSRDGSTHVQAIGKFEDKGNYELDLFGKPAEEMEAHVLASIATFNLPLHDELPPDQLSVSLDDYLTSKSAALDDESTFAPPISLTPLLSFMPIISAQARIVNGTCMRMFFNSHNLREHLALQRSFHLLGNGVFSSRLSHALFDPELESAERHRGIARSGGIMGLRLGGRDTWPPASSELRLALMGVLTDSYISPRKVDKSRTGTFLDQNALPGDLSFAVRDMSEDEIEKCMNPDSNEALDFLRLSYKPPSPLDVVITPVILFKYDQLFKLLLRVIRMLYVVSALFRDVTDRTTSWKGDGKIAQCFRIEAQHFVSSVSKYFFETGIESTWRIFERKLDQVEKRISIDNDNYTLGPDEGLDKLRDYHEHVLDKIMFDLLLRKRQQPVMNLLEEIFAIILRFSKYSRQRALGKRGGDVDEDGLKDMYVRFRKKVGVFITVCRGMSEKKGYGEKRASTKTSGHEGLFDGGDLAEENTIAQLLSTLEMTDYYSKSLKLKDSRASVVK